MRERRPRAGLVPAGRHVEDAARFPPLGDVARCRRQPLSGAQTRPRRRSFKFPYSFEDNKQGLWHSPSLLCLSPLLGSVLNPNEPAGFFETNRRARRPKKKGGTCTHSSVRASVRPSVPLFCEWAQARSSGRCQWI